MFRRTKKDPGTSTNPKSVLRKIYGDEPGLYGVEPHPTESMVFHFHRVDDHSDESWDFRRNLAQPNYSWGEKYVKWSTEIYVMYGDLNWVSKLESEEMSFTCLASRILELVDMEVANSLPILRIFIYHRFQGERHITVFKPSVKENSLNAWLQEIVKWYKHPQFDVKIAET